MHNVTYNVGDRVSYISYDRPYNYIQGIVTYAIPGISNCGIDVHYTIRNWRTNEIATRWSSSVSDPIYDPVVKAAMDHKKRNGTL